MNFPKVCTALLIIAMVLTLLASCDFGSSDAKEEKEQFREPTQININIGSDVTLPEGFDKENATFADMVKMKPTKDGFAFAGWYSDKEFTDYINPGDITAAQYSKGELYPKWINVDPITYTVRTNEATITDSGRANQAMDIVYLNELNSTDLQRAGYTKYIITVSYDVCEVNDGYQYIFLYQDKNCVQPEDDDSSLADMLWGDSLDAILGTDNSNDPSLLYTYKGEHGAKKDTSWGNYYFSAQIDIESIIDNLYIRYGASGKDEDTWRCNNVKVTITPIQ